MRGLKLIIITLLFLNSCLSDKSKDIRIKAKIIDKVVPEEFRFIDGLYYSIKIDLINQTDTVFDFWTMCCSWQENWIINNNHFRFFIFCPKNYPILKEIEPKQKITFDGIIQQLDTSDTILDTLKLKLGFIVIRGFETNENNFTNCVRAKREMEKDVIWSESFNIHK